MLIRGYSGKVLGSVFDAPRHGRAGLFDITDQHRTRSLYCTYFVPAEARTGQGRKEERRRDGRGGSGSGWIYCTSGIMTNRIEAFRWVLLLGPITRSSVNTKRIGTSAGQKSESKSYGNDSTRLCFNILFFVTLF